MTTHQMCCLMLLNGQGSITFKELLDVRCLAVTSLVNLAIAFFFLFECFC